MASFGERLKTAWNAFSSEPEEQKYAPQMMGAASYGLRPDRVRLDPTSEKSTVGAIYNRLGIDVSAIEIKHARLDQNGRFLEEIPGALSECFSIEPNLDQGPTAFRQDIAMTMFDKGVAAIVPVDTSVEPNDSGAYDILSMRVGEIVNWYPRHVRVRLYNDRNGKREEITLPKSQVAIVENPLYSIMNEPNSTLRRLIRKLALLDSIDEVSGSGKLDLIIQLPYVVKSEARKQQAAQRAKDIEFQLRDSQYGIAYTDGSERITQLNRPAENNLMGQIKYLTETLYNQLGLTPEIFNGTADEKTMINYYNRTINPVMASITEAMKRTFLTKTARTQRQSIEYYREPFKLVPVADLAEIADKFTRNEIMTSNEFRGVIGFRPITNDPKADQLRNSNMPHADDMALEGEVVEDPAEIPPTTTET